MGCRRVPRFCAALRGQPWVARNHAAPPSKAQRHPANLPPSKTGHAILSRSRALLEKKELGLRGDDGDTPQRPHTHRRAQGSAGRTAVRGAPGLLTNRGLATGLKGKHTQRQHTHYQAHNRGQDKEGETEEPRNEKLEEPSYQTPWGTPVTEDKGTAGAK